ncbi:MAG TPA: hypothetical protein VGN26_04940 [Armatimonadota bacterium]|jgi:predicted transposase YdaD
MAQPFDAALKEFVQSYPRDWLAQLGLPPDLPVSVTDADLSTVSAQADKVLRIGGAEPWMLHVELQAGRDPFLDRRLLKYNVLLHERHGLPVHSAVVLLRPAADAPCLTGKLHVEVPTTGSFIGFGYQVVRIWRLPAETLLRGGLGTLPLAPVARCRQEELPSIIRRMESRLSAEATSEEAASLWATTYVLMGLRLTGEAAAQLLRGITTMRESATYQSILDEGVGQGSAGEARKLLILLGTKRFGQPDARIRSSVEAIGSTETLERLAERLLDVSSWDALLAAE